jgi:hypothetical protein
VKNLREVVIWHVNQVSHFPRDVSSFSQRIEHECSRFMAPDRRSLNH